MSPSRYSFAKRYHSYERPWFNQRNQSLLRMRKHKIVLRIHPSFLSRFQIECIVQTKSHQLRLFFLKIAMLSSILQQFKHHLNKSQPIGRDEAYAKHEVIYKRVGRDMSTCKGSGR